MIYNTGAVTIVSGSSIVKGSGTKWNSNNPLISPGMLMLIKNGDVNYPYMIKAVNSNTELVLAEEATFSANDTTYTINLTEPNNNSDAARALVAANTYILYFLQNMDIWMGDNGVVEITLPSGKTVKLESIKALQELVEGKADTSSVDDINKKLDKIDKPSVLQTTGNSTTDVMSQNAVTYALRNKQDAGNYANNDGSGVISEIFRRNLGLGDVALKNIGMGFEQIPDMSFFNANLGADAGWFKLPVIVGGQGVQMLVQFGSELCAHKATTTTTFPLPFPIKCLNVIASGGQAGANYDCTVTVNYHTKSSFSSNSFFDGSLSTANNVLIRWIAIGY